MGGKDKPVGKSLPVDRAGFEKHEIPPEIARYIRGRIVDLSTASRYYRKCWAVIHPRVQSEAKRKDESRYQLSGPLFRLFLKHLRKKAAGHYHRAEMSAGDIIALALYEAGCLYKQPPMPDPKPSQLWPDTRPISEAWQRLGNLRIPGGSFFTYEDPGGSELQVPRSVRFQYPRIGMNLTWGMERKDLPKLTIEIEGEPVCLLMKARYELGDAGERRAVRKEAKRIWVSLSKKLLVAAGAMHPSEGKPPGHRGKRAAFLHDHCRLSWRDVAKQLCERKHEHSGACSINFRKQAEQFWKKLGRLSLNSPIEKAQE